jgi:predicted transcriptional regulator
MKLKKVVIQIKSLDDVLGNFVSVAKKLQAGKKVMPSRGTYVADVETARSIFTEGRLRIVQTLKDKRPGSIYALAKLLKRDFKNVYEDVSFLAELGIIAIEENDTGRNQKKPILLCDEILFRMAA